MHADPTARSTHYALTEMGDETRHMVMFGRAIEKVGGKADAPEALSAHDHQPLPLTFPGCALWVAALVGEEIFDSLQRNMMDDPDLQPVVQRIMRIHVTEEARHIQFARDGARKRVAEMPWLSRMWVANLNGVGVTVLPAPPTPRSTDERAWTARRLVASPAPARTTTTCRRSDSPRWPRSPTSV